MAVSAALDYGLAALERGEEHAPPLPTILLSQARLAARNRVSLDIVLRRYFAGYTLLGDFLFRVAEESGLQGESLQQVSREQAALFDRLISAVTEEYARERKTRLGSAGRRRAERVERLLDGELLDVSAIPYDFDARHLGAIAVGPGAAEAVRELAGALDRRLLLIRRSERTVWAWFGGRQSTDPADVERSHARAPVQGVTLALGEPGWRLAGWRLTHRQARAALPIALRGSEEVARYGDVALLASMLQDDLLVTSLRELYLSPLDKERDGGEIARQTLRAYFAVGRNVSSAAGLLGVARNTVANRIRVLEEKLGRQLGSCAVELEAALRLEELREVCPPEGTELSSRSI